jgi:hypothetical protein
MSKLDKYLNIDDLRDAAKRRAHRMVFDYIDGGRSSSFPHTRRTRSCQGCRPGRQPPELTANKLVRVKNLPIDWPGQRLALGFPAP